MRLVRFEDAAGRIRWGRELPGGEVQPLEGDPFAGLADAGPPLRPPRLLAPIEPRAILAVGVNYRAHAAETGREEPARPVLFMKNPGALQHPGAPIRIPASCLDPPQVDYEGELAVVIGRAARDVDPARASDHILGYTCANDVSARRWQRHAGGGQWVRGKSFDTFCPLGPVLVTPDELPEPQALRLRTFLNGEVVQDANTSDMIFGVAALLAELSRDTTLLPGTVLLTGTPGGVGFARTPPVFLAPGDEVAVEIAGIGRLANPVVGP